MASKRKPTDALRLASHLRNLATPVRVLTVKNLESKGTVQITRAGIFAIEGDPNQLVLVYYPESGEFRRTIRSVKKEEPFEVPLLIQDITSEGLELEFRRAFLSYPEPTIGVPGKITQSITLGGELQELDTPQHVTLLPPFSRVGSGIPSRDLEDAEKLRSASAYERAIFIAQRKDLAETTPLLAFPLFSGQGTVTLQSKTAAELQQLTSKSPPAGTQLRLF